MNGARGPFDPDMLIVGQDLVVIKRRFGAFVSCSFDLRAANDPVAGSRFRN